MKQKRYTFSKLERLTGRKAIDELFDSGKSFFVYPLLILYKDNSHLPAGTRRLLISVSKRKFKLAVDRNRIKRQIRECYRIHKFDLLLSNNQVGLDFAIVFVGRKMMSSESLNQKIKEALSQLNKHLND